MKVRLRQIGAEGYKFHQELTPAFVAAALGEHDPPIGRPAEGSVALDLTRTGSRVFVRGRVRARFQVACGRCLEPADVEADAPVLATYLPAGAASPEAPPADLDEPETGAYRGDEIDFTDLVRDPIVLAVPIAPLCREDCKGLCPSCGLDRNLQSCDCPPAAAAAAPFQRPRLA